MNGRKQRRMGRLLVLLSGMGLIVVLPCLIAWWEMRKERLSTQLLVTVRSVQVRSEGRFSEDHKAEREQAKQQTRKDEATVARLLREGADPNVRDVPVVKRTLWEEVKLLLKRALKPPPDPASLPRSALALAVQAQDAVIVTDLLNRGATDVNAEFESRNGLERFPLVNYAADIGNLEMVRALCAHGADIHKLGRDRGEGITILQYTLAMADAYTDSGTLKKDTGVSLECKNRTEIFHLLLAKGAKYEPNSQEGFGLLCAATASDLLEPTRVLLAAGVPVNAKPGRLEVGTEDTPLDNGVAHDDLTLVKLLLQYGAQTRDTRSEAPILLVRSPEMARLLLEHGADPTVCSGDGTTAIQTAKQNADPPSDADGIVALLKDYGAQR